MDGPHDSAQGAIRAVLWRIAAICRIAPEGAAMILAIAALAATLWLVGLPILAGPILLAGAATAAFFRDPDRFAAAPKGAVLSGADGRVVDVGEGAPPGRPATRCQRVSVFMSPLNVHVNRAPIAGEITAVEWTPGEFRAAFSDHASEHNERNLLVIRDSVGREHAMVQVAGYLARRIVCRVRPHDKVQAGQRIGLIMFGSRVDHFLPADYRVTVTRGDRVRAGLTVIGEPEP